MSTLELIPLAPNASDEEVLQRLIAMPAELERELTLFEPERAASDVLTSWIKVFRAYGIAKTARILEEKVRASKAVNELLRLHQERKVLQATLPHNINVAIAERHCRMLVLYAEAQDAIQLGPARREKALIEIAVCKAKLLKELGALTGNDQSADFVSDLFTAQRQYDHECADIDAMQGGEIHKMHLKTAALARFQQRTSGGGVTQKTKESFAEQYKKKMDLYKEFERERDRDIAEIMTLDIDEAFKNRAKRKRQAEFEHQVGQLGL